MYHVFVKRCIPKVVKYSVAAKTPSGSVSPSFSEFHRFNSKHLNCFTPTRTLFISRVSLLSPNLNTDKTKENGKAAEAKESLKAPNTPNQSQNKINVQKHLQQKQQFNISTHSLKQTPLDNDSNTTKENLSNSKQPLSKPLENAPRTNVSGNVGGSQKRKETKKKRRLGLKSSILTAEIIIAAMLAGYVWELSPSLKEWTYRKYVQE